MDVVGLPEDDGHQSPVNSQELKRVYYKEYYAKNRERIKERAKAYAQKYYQENRDKRLAYHKAYAAARKKPKRVLTQEEIDARKERERAASRAWYARNKAKCISWSRAYYAKNRKSTKIPRTPEQKRVIKNEMERQRRANPELSNRIKEMGRIAYAKRRERARALKRENYRKNILARRERARLRMAKYGATPKGKIERALRRSIQRMVVCGANKQRRTCQYLGAPFDWIKGYLESQFKPGMTWDNYGANGWHIDHIKPLAGFDLTDTEQLKQAAHYTNLQPLWATDNLSKGAKIV